MSETATGLRTIASWQREPVSQAPLWPATTAMLTRNRLPVLSLQANDGIQVVHAHSIRQGYGPDSADVVARMPHESWACPLRYGGFEQLLACALGYMAKRLSGVLMPEELTTGVYRHLFELDTGLSTALPWVTADGFTGGELATPLYRVRRGTAAVWRQVSVWEHRSTMVTRLTLSGSSSAVTIGIDLVGHDAQRTGTINTATTLQALPVNSFPNVLFRHGVFLLAPYSMSTPLAGTDRVHPVGWQLSLDNHLSATPGPRTGLAPEEYEKQSGSTGTVSVNVPRYREDTRFTQWREGTPLMGRLRLTGPSIGQTGYAYQITLFLPYLQLSTVHAPVSGPTPGSLVYDGMLHVPPAAPAAWPVTQHLGPLQIELITTVSEHPLLAA